MQWKDEQQQEVGALLLYNEVSVYDLDLEENRKTINLKKSFLRFSKSERLCKPVTMIWTTDINNTFLSYCHNNNYYLRVPSKLRNTPDVSEAKSHSRALATFQI